MVDVRFRPATGPDAWRAAVARSAIAALPPEVTAHTADAVWRRLDAGGIAAVLDALTGAFGTSLTAIPPFALAVVEGDGVRVAVRGPVEIVVETADGAHAVSGSGVATWAERFIPGVGKLTIALTGGMDEVAALPIESGVVPVEALTVTIDAAVHAVPVPAAAAAPEAAAPFAAAPEAAAPEAAEPPAAVIEAAAPEAADPPDLSPLPQLPSLPPLPPLPADVDTWLPAPAVPRADLADMSHVSDRTLAPEPDHTAGPDASAPETPWEATVVRATGPDAAPEPVSRAPLGDHDGATISVAEARALRAAQSAAPEFVPTDDVPARRPARGRIRISDGNVVELERTVVIGRRPRSTRTSDADLPALIAVDSPQHDISRSHVEIRAEGEHVLATDLGTTNGTVLLRGGSDPVRLHPHEPTMVVDGDVLDIGDGVTIAFEDLP